MKPAFHSIFKSVISSTRHYFVSLIKHSKKTLHGVHPTDKRLLKKTGLILILGIIIIPFFILGLSMFIQKYNKTVTIEPYTATELKFKTNKKEFKVTEKPSFKINVGQIKSVDNSPKGRLQRVISMISPVHADTTTDTVLPTLEVSMHRIVRQGDIENTVIHQTGPNEVEVSVQDVRSFHPGKYRITIKSGTRNIEQDFTWGVLAVNTNKSIYSPGETAKIGMALLDDTGRTKCFKTPDKLMQGKMWLTITSPTGQKTQLSTETTGITGSADCDDHSVTNEADFQAIYKTSDVGIYQMHVEGENQNGKRTIDDYFEVRTTQNIVVERLSAPTRIYPVSNYTNTLSIYSKDGFSGEITEKTPASFQIEDCGGCVVEGKYSEYIPGVAADSQATHTLRWNIQLKPNETKTITYTYNPPNISPEFFILGPVSLAEGNSIVFIEARPWQIASDATKTWASAGSNSWNTSANWSPTTVPATTSNVVFDGTSTVNCTIDATPGGSSIADLSLNSGYTGTVTQNAAIAVTTSGAAGITISAGTYTGSSGLVTVSTAGKLTVSGGTFNAGTGGITASTASSTYRLVVSSGTFTGAASGTVTLSGGGLQQTGGSFSGGAMTFTLSGTNATNNGYSVTGGTSHTTTTGTVSVITDLTVDTITTWTNSASTFTFANGANTAVSCDRSIGTNFAITKTASSRTFTNGSGCTMTFKTVSGSSSNGLWTNSGTLTIANAAGTLAMAASNISNTGSFTSNDPITFSTGVLSNTGSGTMSLADTTTWSSTGTITNSGTSLSNSSTITLTTGAITNSSAFTNTGTISTRGNINNTSGSFDNTGGTITILNTNAADTPTFTCGTSSNIAAGTFNLNGTTNGSFTVANSGGTCTLTATVANGAIYNTITNAGALTLTAGSAALITIRNTSGVTGGDIVNTGTLTVNANVTLAVEQDFTSSSGTLVNNGAITFVDTNADTSDDTTFSCQSTVGGTIGFNKTQGTASNANNITVNDGGGSCILSTVTSTSGALLANLTIGANSVSFGGANTLTVNVALTITGTLVNTGTIAVERTLSAGSGTITNTSGTINLVDTNADISDDTTFTCQNTVGGTVGLNKTQGTAANANSVTFSNGTLPCTISSVVASSGNLFSTISVAPTITSFSGANALNINQDLTVTGSFTNAGTVNIERNLAAGTGTLGNSGTINFIDTNADPSDDTTFTCQSTVGGTVGFNKYQATAGNANNIVIVDGGSDCIISSATAPASSLTNTFTTAGTVTFGGGNALKINGNFTNTGTFTNNGTVQVERNFADSGTFTGASGAVVFNDSAADTADTNSWTCGASSNIGNLTINKTVTTVVNVTLASDCTVENFTRTDGPFNNPAAGRILTVNGNFSMATTDTFGGANLTFTMGGGNTQTITQSAGTFSPIFKVDKSGGAANLATTFTVSGQTCTIVEGTFDISGFAFTCATGVTVETGGNFQLQGAETPTAPTLNSGSIVTYDGVTGGSNAFTLKAWVYHHLVINSTDGATDVFSLPSAFTGANDVNGNLTITAGTLDVTSANNYGLDVVGNFSNAGTYLAQAGTLKVGTNFTNTGTFTQGTGTVELNTASTTVVDGSGSPVITFNNLTVTTAGKTVQFTAAKTFRVNGLLTITGTAGNEVVINSTTSSQWFINHQGTENVTYANVTNSGCDGTSTTISVDATSINGGNNGVCWDFPILSITVSGNIYTDEGSTAYDCSANNITVYSSVNGAANDTGTCTLNTGAFSITADKPTAADQPVVIFIDSGESIKATTVTMTADATSNISSVKLYTNHLVLTHESAGPMTNAKLATADNADAGIRYSVATSNLTVDTDIELFVLGSKTYTPGGSVTTQGSLGTLELASSATATLGTATNTISNDVIVGTSATLTVNADMIIEGGDLTVTGLLNTTSGTPTLTLRGTGSISGAGTKTVHNLTIGDGTVATTTLSGALTANGDVAVGTGSTLHQNAAITVSGGDFTTTTTGVVDTTSGTATVTISGTGNLGSGSGGSFSVYTLAVNGTQTLISTITTTDDVSVGNGASLALSSQNLTITGGALTTTGTGTVTCAACSGGTVTMSGTGNIGGGGTVTVYDFTTDGTQTLASDFTTTTATITNGGSLNLGSQNMTVNGGNFTTSGTGIIACTSCSAGTLTMSGTGNLGGGNGNITLYNLTTTGSGTTTFSGGGTNTISNNATVGTGTTLALNSTLAITGSLANTTTGIITTTSGTPTVTVSGSTIGGGSGAITFYNLTKAGAGTTTFSGSGTNTINNNLSVSNGTLTLSNTLTITGDGAVATGATLNTNANLTVNGGDLTTTGTGVINTTSGTPTLTISGTGNLGGGNGNITFHNLTTSGTGTTTFSGGGTNAANGAVTVGTGTTLNINSSFAITGNLVNTTTGIIGTTTGTPTVTVSGTTIGGGSGAITFYNLTKDTASTATFSGSGTNTITNNLSATAGTLTVSNAVTVGGDVAVSTSTTLNINADMTVSGGAMTTAGTGVITTTSGTPTITISGTGNIGGGGTVTTYNMTVNGTQTLSSGLVITNDLVVDGTLSGSSNITVAGGFTGAGTVTMSGGTTEQRVAAAENFGTNTGSNAWTFSTLILSNSTGASKTVTTQTGGSGGITVSTLLQIGKGGDSAVTVLDGGNRSWTLSNTGTPFTIPNGSFTPNTSTVLYTGNGATSVTSTTYYGLTIGTSNSANISYTALGNITANNIVTLQSAASTFVNTFDLSTYNLTVGSTSVTNSGSIIVPIRAAITQSSSGTTTVQSGASGAFTIGGAGTTTFYNLTIGTASDNTSYTGSLASAVTVNGTLTITSAGTGTHLLDVTASNYGLTVKGNWTNSQGTSGFNGRSGTVTLDGAAASTQQLSGSTNFSSLTATASTARTLRFASSDTQAVSGVLTITGASGQLITMTTISGTTQWNLNVTGSANVSYVDASYANSLGIYICAANSSSTSGNNTNFSTAAGACASLSGVAYQDEGTTPIDGSISPRTVGVLVNGAGSFTATITTNTGAWSLSSISYSSGDIITAYLKNGTENANTVFVSNGSAQNNVDLYQNRVIVRADTGSITNANLATGTDSNGDMLYSVATGNLTVVTDTELHVWTGDIYAPGGTVTTQGTGSLHLGTNATATLANATNAIANDLTVETGATLTINADTTVSGGDVTTVGSGLINTTSGTPTLTVSGTGNIGGGGTITTYNLTVSGTQTLQSAITANNDISVGTGATLVLNNQNVTVSGGDMTTTSTGSITCSGCSSNTVTVNGTGATGIGGGSGGITFYNLTIGGTVPLASAVTINNDFTPNGTTTGSSNVTVNGAVTGTGTLTFSGGTFNQRVAAAEAFGTTSGSNAWTFSTLILSNSSGSSRTITTQTGGSGGITASVLLQIGPSGDTQNTVLDAGNRTWTIAGTSCLPLDIVNGSVTANTSTISYTGNCTVGSTSLADITYYNLLVNNGSETWVTNSGFLTVTNNLTVTAGELALSGDSALIGSSSVTNSGNISVAGTLSQTSGTTTVRTSASGTASIGGNGTLNFGILTIAPTVASSTITLGNGASQTITTAGALTVGDGTNTVTVTANTNNPTIDINGAVITSTNGTFIAPPSATFTIAGNITNNGTFTHNSGTVTIDGSGTSIFSGASTPAITFYNLDSTTAGKTMTFTAAQTFRVNGLLNIVGAGGNNITINSTTASQWLINHQGTEYVRYATITNAGCDGSSTTITLDNTDVNGGNNGVCWDFPPDAGSSVGKRIQGTTRIGGNTRIK